MTALEMAKKQISEMNTKQLIEVWELTTNNDSEYVPMVRGWLMDEFEARQPEAFEAWIDSENCEDAELKNYLKV